MEHLLPYAVIIILLLFVLFGYENFDHKFSPKSDVRYHLQSSRPHPPNFNLLWNNPVKFAAPQVVLADYVCTKHENGYGCAH